MATVFMSHATGDKDRIRPIAEALRHAGLEVWVDESELGGGDALLAEIARVLEVVDVVCVAMTPLAFNRPWVLAETRMAMTAEIERGRPRVIALVLDDVSIPLELRHKLYIDFRGRFDDAIADLVRTIQGVHLAPPIPKQAALASMLMDADDVLWDQLVAGAGRTDEWSQEEMLDLVRGLTTRQLEAAVAIASNWRDDKMWPDQAARLIGNAIGETEGAAHRILQTLLAKGLYTPATDRRDYQADDTPFVASGASFILGRAARHSGLFENLPRPKPLVLSEMLGYGSVQIIGRGWSALRFPEAMITAVDPSCAAIATVTRQNPPATWAFATPTTREPMVCSQSFAESTIVPGRPFPLEEQAELVLMASASLDRFDDLGVLTEPGAPPDSTD